MQLAAQHGTELKPALLDFKAVFSICCGCMDGNNCPAAHQVILLHAGKSCKCHAMAVYALLQL
jgi:hypothetical protein